ncbi:enoyl-CoA hydratase/isomerase family protein [Variovorax paradoxus]|nr:enoyl-CoA hydratase/isomerase family protein [Variovorax paradoxus]
MLAMVSGYCLGAGLAIALSCDMRLAAENASFGIPAAKLGLPYYYSEIKALTDLVGPARAKQMIFTADRVRAQRALQDGLADEVLPQADLLAFVMAMAARIAGNAPITIAAAKHAVSTAMTEAPGRDIATCDATARACLESEDHVEGRRAFKEKRVPIFKGK